MEESKVKEAGRKILGRFRNAYYVIGIYRRTYALQWIK